MSCFTVLLNSSHIKNEFNSGQEQLDTYLHRQAMQDIKRHLSACFVAVTTENSIKGYYTLSNSSIPKELIPEHLKNRFPYNDIPVTLLGRLARDKKYNGERLGELLLIDALKSSYNASLAIGSIAIIVYPIDRNAKNFFLKYGFIELPDSKRMFIPMKTISALF